MIWIISALIQTAVPPEHVAAYSRMDTVSSYPANAGVCKMLGYSVTDNFAYELADRAISEAKQSGVSEATANAWASEGVRRHVSSFQHDLRNAASSSGRAEIVASVKAAFDNLATKCSKIAADPISVGIFASVSPEAMREARLSVEDPLLEGLGAASWQTPAIWARGELLMGIGVCKIRLSQAEHDQLLSQHLPASPDSSPADRWMAGQYVQGIRSSVDMGLDATQCRRLVSARVAALNVASR